MLRIAETAVKKIAYAFIGAYRASLSAHLGGACRFTPSCSQYAHDALNKYPMAVALGKTARRIARCHPFSRGGWDPA